MTRRAKDRLRENEPPGESIEAFIDRKNETAPYVDFNDGRLSGDIPKGHPIFRMLNHPLPRKIASYELPRTTTLMYRESHASDAHDDLRDVRFALCIGVTPGRNHTQGWQFEEDKFRQFWYIRASEILAMRQRRAQVKRDKETEPPTPDAQWRDFTVRSLSDSADIRMHKELNETLNVDIVFYVLKKQKLLTHSANRSKDKRKKKKKAKSQAAMEVAQSNDAARVIHPVTENDMNHLSESLADSTLRDTFNFNDLSTSLP